LIDISQMLKFQELLPMVKQSTGLAKEHNV
jgi:hypothetical protein